LKRIHSVAAQELGLTTRQWAYTATPISLASDCARLNRPAMPPKQVTSLMGLPLPNGQRDDRTSDDAPDVHAAAVGEHQWIVPDIHVGRRRLQGN